MKRINTLIISMLSVVLTYGQITLNSTYNLQPGDTYRYDIYDEVQSIDPGPAGAGVQWDFGSITGGTFIAGEPAICVNPAGTPFADSATVAGANICTRPNGTDDGAYAYYLMTSGEQVLLGIGAYESGNVSFWHYDDEQVAMEYPITYGGAFSDNFDMRLFSSGIGSYFMRDSGSIHVQADAYGSLITPVATYNNVLRITETSNTYSWMNFGSGWTFTGNSDMISYYWFAENIKVPVFTIIEFVGFADYSVHYLVDHNFPSGVGENEIPSVKIFPNPVNETLYFTPEESMISVSIYSIEGRMMKECQNEFRKGILHQLDVGNLPSGVYVLEGKNIDGICVTNRFLKR
ncbi:MAG: T9SS type A sorting domain-containing protein [Bacteroidetes bacterium]|nr:T9SS type A sorting domain-containing protein [Bacteroidota bacterium]